MMYNLRSRKKYDDNDNAEVNLSDKNKPIHIPISKPTPKRHISHKDTRHNKLRKISNLFNPDKFIGDNEYDNIIDSSDESKQDSEPSSEFSNDSIESSGYDADSSSSELSSDSSSSELDEEGHLDKGYDPDTNEYFDINTAPLISIITKKLATKFPELSKEDINKAVKTAIEKGGAGLVEEYCEAPECSWAEDSKCSNRMRPMFRSRR